MASGGPFTGSDVDTSKIDFYDFLSLPGPQATDSEIKRAGRKTSLLYHPDKVAPTPENLQNFHILQIAIQTLSDPAEKAKYDQTREAKQRRKAEIDALDSRRRKMREDLENREATGDNFAAGQKRTFSEREMKIRRIQEDNRRKIEEMKARKKFEAEQLAAQDRAKATNQEPAKSSNEVDASDDSMARSIKLRWLREDDGQSYDESSIGALLGDGVEDVVLLKDKKRKHGGKKVILGTAVVVFSTLQAAKTAMDGHGAIVDKFETIEWASKGKDQP